MTFTEWRQDCPRLYRAHLRAEEVCAIHDHAMIKVWGKWQRHEHSVFFECSEEKCTTWQELYGERRHY